MNWIFCILLLVIGFSYFLEKKQLKMVIFFSNVLNLKDGSDIFFFSVDYAVFGDIVINFSYERMNPLSMVGQKTWLYRTPILQLSLLGYFFLIVACLRRF